MVFYKSEINKKATPVWNTESEEKGRATNLSKQEIKGFFHSLSPFLWVDNKSQMQTYVSQYMCTGWASGKSYCIFINWCYFLRLPFAWTSSLPVSLPSSTSAFHYHYTYFHFVYQLWFYLAILVLVPFICFVCVLVYSRTHIFLLLPVEFVLFTSILLSWLI